MFYNRENNQYKLQLTGTYMLLYFYIRIGMNKNLTLGYVNIIFFIWTRIAYVSIIIMFDMSFLSIKLDL